MSDWLCWHVGTVTDPKFTAVTKRSGVSRPCVLVMWAYLLERAKQSDDPGTFGKIDPEDCAIATGISEEDVPHILAAFEAKGLICGEKIANWKKRQNKTSTERVREWRERQAQLDETRKTISPVSETVAETEGNAETGQTDRHNRQTDITDRQREDLAPQAPSKNRGSRIAADWSLTEDLRQIAIQTRESAGLAPLDVDLEAAKFHDFWRAKSGRDGTKLDWTATWRNWVRNARGPASPAASQTNAGSDDWLARAQARAEAAAREARNG